MSKLTLSDNTLRIFAEGRAAFAEEMRGWRLHRVDPNSQPLSERPDIQTALLDAYDAVLTVGEKMFIGRDMDGSESESTKEAIARVAAEYWIKLEKLPGINEDMAYDFLGAAIRKAGDRFEMAEKHTIRVDRWRVMRIHDNLQLNEFFDSRDNPPSIR